jgi:hypothetical protein
MIKTIVWLLMKDLNQHRFLCGITDTGYFGNCRNKCSVTDTPPRCSFRENLNFCRDYPEKIVKVIYRMIAIN